MQINRPKAISLGIVLVGLLGISVIPKFSDSSKALSPDRCLSKPYEVLAEHEHYQVIQEVTESYGHHHQEILVSIVNGICSRLNVEVDGMDYPFARYIDLETSIELNQQIWQMRIEEVGGQEKFEQDFADFANQPAFQTIRTAKPKPPEQIYMPFDKYQALSRLGVKIPANVKPAAEPQFKPRESRPTSKDSKSDS